MRELSIPCDMLAAMDVRWDAAAKAAAFPMRDAEGKVTGIRYRQLKTAKKWALKGSKDGLFFIPGFIPISEEIVVCEGPTDMLAAASVGLNAVGRSACLTGAALLRDFIKRHHVRRVTIIADDDPPKPKPGGGTWRPGIDGAKKLAADLGIAARIVLPFPGFKDIREWYAKGGLTKEKFETAAKTANWSPVFGVPKKFCIGAALADRDDRCWDGGIEGEQRNLSSCDSLTSGQETASPLTTNN